MTSYALYGLKNGATLKICGICGKKECLKGIKTYMPYMVQKTPVNTINQTNFVLFPFQWQDYFYVQTRSLTRHTHNLHPIT